MFRWTLHIAAVLTLLGSTQTAFAQEVEPEQVDHYAYNRMTEDDVHFVGRLLERRTFRGPVIRKTGYYIGMDAIGKRPVQLATSNFYKEFAQNNKYQILPLFNLDMSTKTSNTNIGFMYIPDQRIKAWEGSYMSGRFGQDFQLIKKFWNGRGLVASYHVNYSALEITRFRYIGREDLTSIFQYTNYNFDGMLGYRGEDTNLMAYAGGGLSTTDATNTDDYWGDSLVIADQFGYGFVGVGFCGADDVICITAEYHGDSDVEGFGVVTVEVRR